MATVTLPVTEEFKSQLKRFAWINWSEIAREEALKKVIFESYMKTGKISDEDWEFCDKIDWHPVDELPIKEELKKELIKRKKGPFVKLKSVEELFR
ncbi:MAG: hypothetical protein QW666_03565 [Candidatus Woesearchaeota archaeon]